MTQKKETKRVITFETDEPMRFYSVQNDETNLKKLEKKFEKNPFVFEKEDNAVFTLELPTKKQNESDEQFIGRCMNDEVMNSEFTDYQQRYAVCKAQLIMSKEK